MLKKDWNKEFKKLTYFKGVDPFKVEPTPYRDWRIVAVGFFVGLIVLSGFNIYMSIKINRDSFFSVTPKNEKGIVFDREGLSGVLQSFTEKEAIFEKLRIEGVSVVDPSL